MEKLEEVFNFLKNYLNKNGYPPSVREMCIGLNVKSTATIYYYLKMLEEAKMIKKSPQKNRAVELISDTYDGSEAQLSENVKVPLLGNIASGETFLSDANVYKEYSLPSQFFADGQLFMWTVTDKSMEKSGIFTGDKIIVRRQNSAENGDIAVVILDGITTLRRFVEEDGRAVLRSDDCNIPESDPENVSIIGVVSGLIRSFS